MFGQQYEAHIQCPCGGTLIAISTPNAHMMERSLQEENFNIWRYEEVLTFDHRGKFTEACVDFKAEVIKNLQEEKARSVEGLLGKFISRPKHG